MHAGRFVSICVVAAMVLAPLLSLPFPGEAKGLRMRTDLSMSHASFWGEDVNDFSGSSVACAGDVNADGYDDFIIGAWGDDDSVSDAGQTYLILGKASGWAMDTDLSAASASFWGEGLGEFAGHSVAGAGDVNGDGFDDFIIGAERNNDGGQSAGQTYLILGKASGWAMDTRLSAASASFWGEDAWDYSGSSVAGVGDVNGDGFDDFIIGAFGDADGGSNAGQTYLILGKVSGWAMDTDLSAASAAFWGEDMSDWAGHFVAGAGDVNGDGFDDFIIGAEYDDDGGSNAGQTYLILGKASGWAMDTDLSAASASFWGEDANDNSGDSVAGAGDVNGDGYDDFLIGAYGDDDGGSSAGQTYLILGKASGWAMDTDLSAASASFWGEDAGDDSGTSVAGAGDVNGDGYDDFIIGAEGDDDGGSWAGQTYLILGKASGWAMDTDLSKASASFCGEDAEDYSGVSAAGAGDVNGDGYDDFIIGANGDDDGSTYAGQTYLILPFCKPPVPNNLQATPSAVVKMINLTWDSAGPWNEHIVGYRVFVSTDGTNFRQVAFRLPSDRSYSDTNVTYGRTYFYVVVTEDRTGALSERTSIVSLVCDRDTDLDGIGDMVDWDDDGDGVADGSDAFPLNSGETLDTDWDGTGNNADTDDDNDGILDSNDPEPCNPQNALQYNLNYLNSTLQTVQGTVNSAYSTITTMNTSLNTLSSSIASMQTSLTGLINNIDSDIAALNSQVMADISGLNTTVLADMAALQAGMNGLNVTMVSNLNGIRMLISDVSSDLSGLGAEIAAMNKSLGDDIAGTEAQLKADIAGMETRLKADIGAIDLALDVVNESIHAQISGLGSDIDGFRADMEDSLAAILARLGALDSLDANQTKMAMDIRAMISGLNATSLANMQQTLAEILARSDLLDTDLSTKVSDFRNGTMTRLDNISKAMLTVDDIKSLTTEVKGVQAQVNAVKDEQATTSKNVAALGMPSWLSAVMIIVVLVLAIVLLMMSRGKKGEPLPAQPAEAPPGQGQP